MIERVISQSDHPIRSLVRYGLSRHCLRNLIRSGHTTIGHVAAIIESGELVSFVGGRTVEVEIALQSWARSESARSAVSQPTPDPH